ncbi:MAG: hypothetical protein ACR2RV_11330 [Verrucomicrobiales bacterium]
MTGNNCDDDSGWERSDAWIGLALMAAGSLICFIFYQIISGDMWPILFFAGFGWLAGPLLLLTGGACFYWGITARPANHIQRDGDEHSLEESGRGEANRPTSPQPEPPIRTLTITESKTVRAKLLSRRGDLLGVEIDGKHHEFPISSLSPDDQRFIDSQMPGESS